MRKTFCRLGVLGLLPLSAWLVGCPQQTPDPGPQVNSGLTGQYVGSDRCITCHNNRHTEWAQTAHARAFEDLQALGQAENPVCLTCHTTGFNLPGGFVDPITTQALADVGCEACHGPSRAHVENVADVRLRPTVSIASEICSQCHNGFHHDLYSQWSSSRHAHVTEDVAASVTAGSGSVATCGACHSGDYRLARFIEGLETVPNTIAAGVPASEQNAVECAICHNPHANTGNALNPPAGHDYMLRYPEVATPTQTNDIVEVQNQDRFNLCGQCHKARGRMWTNTDRGPHHSIQANFYLGEMPTPDGLPSLVPNTNSAHRFVQKQCVTCHMQPQEGMVDIGVENVHANHNFRVVSVENCSTSGCHPTPAVAQADWDALRAEITAGLENIASRLGDPSTWEYSSEGGPPPAEQALLPDEIKKARFLYHWVLADGSEGVHNPSYARVCISTAQMLLTQIGR